MSDKRWKVTFEIYRQKSGGEAHTDRFTIEVDPDEYVLDGVERIWANHDRTLVFRHACHHSACGACGMRVNGMEKLTCITRVGDVTSDGGVLRVEPLRNFPVVSDLAVDMGSFYRIMDEIGAAQIVSTAEQPLVEGIRPSGVDDDILRLADCIECGLCISACSVMSTDSAYLGPAALAAIQLRGLEAAPELVNLADSREGVWRCHSIYDCSAVCPSNMEPGWRIMDLRRQTVARRFKQLFQPHAEVTR